MIYLLLIYPFALYYSAPLYLSSVGRGEQGKLVGNVSSIGC